VRRSPYTARSGVTRLDDRTNLIVATDRVGTDRTLSSLWRNHLPLPADRADLDPEVASTTWPARPAPYARVLERRAAYCESTRPPIPVSLPSGSWNTYFHTSSCFSTSSGSMP